MKAIPFPIALICLILQLSSCDMHALDQNYALTEFHKGNREYFFFDFAEAQEHYELALEINPDLAMARNNYANALFRQEDFKGAIDAYDVLAKDYPEYAKAFYNRGLAHSYLNQYQLAVKDLSQAIELFNVQMDSAEYISCVDCKLNNILNDTWLMDSLCKHHRELITGVVPTELKGTLLVSQILLQKLQRNDTLRPEIAKAYVRFNQDLAKLMACCECSSSPVHFEGDLSSPTFTSFFQTKEELRDPEHTDKEEKYEARESAHYYMNKLARLNTPATDSLDFRTLWVDHALAYAHMKRGIFRQRLRAYKGAIHDYGITIDINRDLRDSLPIGEIYFNRGNCYQALATLRNSEEGDSLFRLAIRDYHSAINNPEDTAINAESRYQIAVCLLGLRRFDSALAMLDTCLIQLPADPRPLVKRAQCLHAKLGLASTPLEENAALDSIPKVIEAYTAALEVNPDLPSPLFNRGNCYFANGEYEFAFMDYSACLLLTPNYANALYMRGLTRKEMGDLEGAAHDLNTAGERGHPYAIQQSGSLKEQIKQ